ncbi:MAG: DUF2249 domain-containing protein [Micrococcales bacterium]|nr:DUF2249 domain-containing protein [Micrococcales bacterium]
MTIDTAIDIDVKEPAMSHQNIPLTEKAACGCDAEHGIPELDVRAIPHAIRHATVFGAFGAIPAGGSLDLVAPHNPLPLLAQLKDRFGDLEVTYLKEGPQDWTLRLTHAS